MNIFDKAAEAINRLGWIQFELKNSHGVCLVGGMYEAHYGSANVTSEQILATPQDDNFQEAWDILCDEVDKVSDIDARYANPSYYNDCPSTRKEDVLTLLRSASAALDRKHPPQEEMLPVASIKIPQPTQLAELVSS